MRFIKIPTAYWIVVSSIILVTVVSSYFVSNNKVDFNAEVKPLLNKIVEYTRYTKTDCRNRKISKKKETSINQTPNKIKTHY